MWLCTLLVHTPHTIQVWGIVSFIIAGFYHNLHFDKRKSTPHFLFILTSRIGVGRTNYRIYIMDKKSTVKYAAPKIEVILALFEHGFSLSLGGDDPDPSRPGESPIYPDEDTDW